MKDFFVATTKAILRIFVGITALAIGLLALWLLAKLGDLLRAVGPVILAPIARLADLIGLPLEDMPTVIVLFVFVTWFLYQLGDWVIGKLKERKK